MGLVTLFTGTRYKTIRTLIYIYFSTIDSEKLHYILQPAFQIPWMPCIPITDYFKKYSLQPDLNAPKLSLGIPLVEDQLASCSTKLPRYI